MGFSSFLWYFICQNVNQIFEDLTQEKLFKLDYDRYLKNPFLSFEIMSDQSLVQEDGLFLAINKISLSDEF
jgi:hypothetical protein